MDEDYKIISFTIIVSILVIILGIAIPRLISEKRNIEKELQLKQMEITLKEIEVYGEKRGANE